MPSSPATAATHVQRRLLPALAVSIVFAAAAATPAAAAATHRAAPAGWAGRITHQVPPPAPTAILPPVGPVRADVAAARVGAV
jgi:hypothetical protein